MQLKPSKQIDVLQRKDWQYVPKAHSDIRQTFMRVLHELALAEDKRRSRRKRK